MKASVVLVNSSPSSLYHDHHTEDRMHVSSTFGQLREVQKLSLSEMMHMSDMINIFTHERLI